MTACEPVAMSYCLCMINHLLCNQRKIWINFLKRHYILMPFLKNTVLNLVPWPPCELWSRMWVFLKYLFYLYHMQCSTGPKEEGNLWRLLYRRREGGGRRRGRKAVMFCLWHFWPSKHKAQKCMLGLGFDGLFWDVVHPSAFFSPHVRDTMGHQNFEKLWKGKLISVIEMVSKLANWSVSCASCLVTRKRCSAASCSVC